MLQLYKSLVRTHLESSSGDIDKIEIVQKKSYQNDPIDRKP